MKLEMTNLESLKAFRASTIIEEEVLILSHAPYDLFEQTISAHITQFIGYSPSLEFNAFGDVVMRLIALSKETHKVNVAYVLNWADLVPILEMSSRQSKKTKLINEEELLEKLSKHISILKRANENPNVNLVIHVPDINETYLAMGHAYQKLFINRAYCQLLQSLDENSLIFEFKTGGQNLSNYFKYHIYDDLKSIISIARGISNRFFSADYQLKVIFVDLDNTIWPSNIGDWVELPLISSESNKTFHYLQALLKKLSSSGVLLVAVSKNDEHYVMDKFDKIEMPLSSKDFYSISCSWKPKSQIIRKFLDQINVLPEHCLFLDDNPVELLEVNSVISSLKSIHVSKEISDYDLLINYLQTQLNTSTSTRENEARKIIRPVSEKESDKDYLKELSLSLKVNFIEDLTGRPYELINKTNQFNLNGIRLDSSDLESLKKAFTVDLKDIYGDFGTVGVIVFSELDTKIVVHNFVLSCRAFSRGIEFEMINVVRKYAKEKTICFEYKKTDRNNVLGDLINILTNHAESEFMLIDKLFEKKLNEYNGVLNVS
jgi:FkbH-like protein